MLINRKDYIDDLYHEQKIIKDGVFPAEVLAQSVNFRPQCVGVSPRHGVWATLDAGRWILATPFAWVVIASGMLFDHLVRLFVTLNSTYLQLLDLPEASFGLIGAGIALLGVSISRFAPALTRHSPGFNFALLVTLCLVGLAGAACVLPWGLGLIPVALIHSVLLLTGYLASHYLNAITDSAQRATVLSFKGLAFNLGYGALGLLYAALLVILRDDSFRDEEAVFQASLPWLFGYGMMVFLLFAGLVALWGPANTFRQPSSD